MLVDSNILVFAINSDSPKHLVAQRFLLSLGRQFFVAHQNILESARVLTHPKFTNPMSYRQAHEAIERIISHATLLSPNETTYAVWAQLMTKYAQKGDAIFDTYLVATAIAAGITSIATDNTKDFSCFKGIKLINPFR